MKKKNIKWTKISDKYPPIGVALICKDFNGKIDEFYFHSVKHKSDCMAVYGLEEWAIL